ncbi:DUF3109 family protein [Halalkalibaculum sp. DA3122]|uniref:DUF3109 family protein n=1 Tax=unclassified Halalkalibaculum TaxID=2964617 RepID=UPI003754ADE5
MFRVQNTILSEDIATAKFACNISRCRGACCVVGDAGAPVDKKEIPVLKKAYRRLKDRLRPEAVQAVEEQGLVQGDKKHGYELSCVDDGECIFVTFDPHGNAKCAIQEAYYKDEFSWEKPLSCHLFPIRLKRLVDLDYANFTYFPSLCSAGCDRGKKEGIWLSDFLEKPLIRRYGEEWYSEFLEACNKIRVNNETVDV